MKNILGLVLLATSAQFSLDAFPIKLTQSQLAQKKLAQHQRNSNTQTPNMQIPKHLSPKPQNPTLALNNSKSLTANATPAYRITFPSEWKQVPDSNQLPALKQFSETFEKFIPHAPYTETGSMSSQWYDVANPMSWLVLNVFKQPANGDIKLTFRSLSTVLQALGLVVNESGSSMVANNSAKWWFGTLENGVKGYLVCFGNSQYCAIAFFTGDKITTQMHLKYDAVLQTFHFPK